MKGVRAMPWWDAFGGILVAFVLSKIYIANLTFWAIVFAIGFSLLPDIDFLIWLLRHHWKIDKWAHEHRNLFHYPLIYLPLGSLLVWCLTNDFYGLLFFFCSLVHFAHDSVAIGWGIRWFSPFSEKNYKFFTRKHLGEKRQFIVSWNPAELKEEVLKRGKDNWFKNKKYYKYT